MVPPSGGVTTSVADAHINVHRADFFQIPAMNAVEIQHLENPSCLSLLHARWAQGGLGVIRQKPDCAPRSKAALARPRYANPHASLVAPGEEYAKKRRTDGFPRCCISTAFIAGIWKKSAR